MRFPFTKPETLTDEALDEIAAEDEQRRAALIERERRAEERRIAAEKMAAEEAEAEKRRKVAALLAEHAALGEEAVLVNGALDAGVIGIKCVIEKRAALVDEVRRVQGELRTLGAQAPPFGLTFTREAKAAARVVVRAIEGEMVEAPFADAARNNPGAFFK